MADADYQVLARKWRPQEFESVVGQEHITRTLQNALASGRIGHAFLFIGSRGIGKTTTARILAKAFNCLKTKDATPEPCGECENCTSIARGTNIDVIEIDGASNNSVDDVRDIRENVRMVPASSRYKIYIIDEVHQLSGGAFNALLKTLEEPPPHAKFILATTEAHKIPATIVSRCQRFDFRRVGVDQLMVLLRNIIDAEGIVCSDEALNAIARSADGGIRDAQSILEQLMSFCDKEIRFQDVFDVLGLVDWNLFHELCDAIMAKDIGTELRIIEDIVTQGKDLSQFVDDILHYFRNLLVCKTADPKKLLALPDADIARMQERADKFRLMEIIRLVEQFAELTKDFDSQLAQRIALEALLIRVSKVAVEVSIDTILEKIAELGAGGVSGAALAGDAFAASPAQQPSPAAPAKTYEEPAPAASEQGSAAKETPTPQEPDEEPEPKPAAQKPVKKKLQIGADNWTSFWKQMIESRSGEDLSLCVHLGMARPIAVEDGVLVLHFDGNGNAQDTIERTASRAKLEGWLKDATTNLTTFRCETSEPRTHHEAPSESALNRLPIAANVNPEEARTLMKDPHIAAVLEVFRGNIVQINHRRKQK